MKKDIGTVSIGVFIFWRISLFLKDEFSLSIDPVRVIIVTYLLLILGIVLGVIGIKEDTTKVWGIIGLLLNILGMIMYSTGLLSVFRDS